MNKSKLTLTITAMVLVTMIAVVSIIAVFAARTQNFTSSINVKYTSREVQGTASAQYFTCGENIGIGWQDMRSADGETELNFELEQINDAALSPEDIELKDVNDYAVFKYDFTNDGPHPYELTMTYQDNDIPDENIKLYVTVLSQFQTEYLYEDGIDGEFSGEHSIKEAKELYMDGNVFTDSVNTIVVPNSKIRIYLLLEVMNWNIDATFSGSINFDLDGTKTEDYTEEFYYYTNGDTATLIGVAKGTPSECEDYGIKYNLMEESVLNIPTEYNGLPVKTIGVLAFAYQTNLTTISSFGNVDCLASHSFYCSGLSGNLFVPGSVKRIYNAFRSCSAINNVELEYGVQTLGLLAFEECNNLTNISIPKSVEEIGRYAFVGCKIKTLTIPEKVTQMGVRIFGDEVLLDEIKIDSQSVCNNLLYWETDIEKVITVNGKIYAKYEIAGLLDWSNYGGDHFTKSQEKDADGYWVYTKVAG